MALVDRFEDLILILKENMHFMYLSFALVITHMINLSFYNQNVHK